MTRLVLVADDLTGAADCVATMAPRATTSIVLDMEAEWPAADALAPDTDSRYCTEEAAAERVIRAANRGSALGARLFKKIDSTLRGNIAVELRAMAGALSRGTPVLIVVAPAFPATGRTTVGGQVYVHGAPLAAPRKDRDVVRLLQAGGLITRHVPVEELADAQSLAETFGAARSAGVAAVVVDGEVDAHLSLVAEAADLAEQPLLLAGSGGLARSLGGLVEPGRPNRPPHAAAQQGNVLVVVGSRARMARAQVESLAACPDVSHVALSPNEPQTASTLRAALARGHAVLALDPHAPVRLTEAPTFARSLARAALGALDRVSTLVATGGETARAILTEAGADRLDVLGEREPGVVHSHVPALGIDMVTKAGAFGDAGSLLRCLAPLGTQR